MPGDRPAPSQEAGSRQTAWWNALLQMGLIVAPVVLEEVFGPHPRSPGWYKVERLRQRYVPFAAWAATDEGKGQAPQLHRWLDDVLEDFLGSASGEWLKGPQVPEKYTCVGPTGERLRPQRVLLRPDGSSRPALLVVVDRNPRLGIGKGRKAYGNLLRILRSCDVPLGLLTNGRQFRLVFAGLDHEAWVQWEAEAWFAGAEMEDQLHGFFTVMGPWGTAPRDGMDFPLLHAVHESRTRQADLSVVLGEHVRRAVEILVGEFNRNAQTPQSALPRILGADPDAAGILDQSWLDALYQAATRIVMRLVVILFAEARELLPKSLETYYDGYSVEGLYEELRQARQQAEDERALESQHGTYRRLLALFNLVYYGSNHPDLSFRAYGGGLFAPGSADSTDPVDRALAAFAHPECRLSDITVYQVLHKLKYGKVRTRQGRTTRWVAGPVNFSDLRTEYIGIMYEGLLDYELKQVDPEEEPLVTINLGHQPLMPLRQLESMTDEDVQRLVTNLVKAKTLEVAGDEEDKEGVEDEPEGLDETESDGEDEGEDGVEDDDDVPAPDDETASGDEQFRRRAEAWAERAVVLGRLVRKPHGRRADMEAYREGVARRAKALVGRLLLRGDVYLVRWGGTRKGSGTFYTRPQLAVPTAHRVLEPLVYEQLEDGTRRPRKPEEILGLKVVDPAMGSGAFLVAALRYLADALYESLRVHNRLEERPSANRTVVTLPFGRSSTGRPIEELVPAPSGDEKYEVLLKGRLKRHVVERCIYGVDINSLAVELARLALWVETMDRYLPFEFLDHKLKTGNALVGCWLDRFEDYPILAWEREGGDGAKGPMTRRIREIRKRARQELPGWVERLQQLAWRFDSSGDGVEEVQAAARRALEEMHELPREEREGFYRERVQGSSSLAALKQALDRWCAIWFWPVMEDGPPPPTPARFRVQDDAIDDVVRRLAEDDPRHRFFHWELEFPDVFTPDRRGFDAVLGNPPWDTKKPLSQEFFSSYDPVYRSYGKQEANEQQQHLFAQNPRIEQEWLDYRAYFKAFSNWVRNATAPFEPSLARSNREKELGRVWRAVRARRGGYAHSDHPYRHQGKADLNSYKMFLEVAHHLLRDGGRMGLLVPSGLYTDLGCAALRRLFLDECRWTWVYGFENRKKVFDIDSRYKFAPVVIERGGPPATSSLPSSSNVAVRRMNSRRRSCGTTWRSGSRPIRLPCPSAGSRSWGSVPRREP